MSGSKGFEKIKGKINLNQYTINPTWFCIFSNAEYLENIGSGDRKLQLNALEVT